MMLTIIYLDYFKNDPHFEEMYGEVQEMYGIG